MQSRRATVPTIDGVSELADLAAHPGLVVADPRGAHVSDLAMPGDGEWLVVVGPEGGLDPEELAGTPGQRLRLGPQVLRAETAAIAAAATVNTRRVVRA